MSIRSGNPFRVLLLLACAFPAPLLADLSDPVSVLLWRFNGGAAPGCQDAADSNGDGGIDIADAVHLLGYLFLEGALPPSPGPESCGLPPKPGLGCASYGSCKP